MDRKSFAAILLFGLAACDSASDQAPDAGGCTTDPALTVFTSRCSLSGCHVPGGQYPDFSANGLLQLVGKQSHENAVASLVVPGDPDSSWIYRKVTGMQGPSGGALMPLGAAMPIAEVTLIHDWIQSGASTQCGGDPGTNPTPVDPNTLDQSALFSCPAMDKPASSPARIRRIDQPEWAHAISTPNAPTFWGSTSYQNPFTNQSGAPYSTYSLGQTLDLATLDLYFLNLPEAAAAWDAKSPQMRTYTVYYDAALACIYNTAQPSAACLDHFVDRFLTVGVLSRTPTADESARLRAYLVAAIAREPGGGDITARAATLDEVAAAEWLTASALFRSETGAPVQDDPAGRRRLTNEELALALGAVLSSHRPGSPMWFSGSGFVPPSPDDTTPDKGWLQKVRAAAVDGSIQDPAVMRSLIMAHAGGNDPLRRDTLFDTNNDTRNVPARGEYWLAPRIIGFFREWLAYGGAINAFKDTPGATSRFTTSSNPFDPTTLSFVNLQTRYYGFDSTLVNQLDDTIARAVIDSATAHGNVFQSLMTTRLWRLPSDQSQTNGQTCSTSADCTMTGYTSCTALKLCGNSISGSTSSVDRPYNLENVPDTAAGRWVTMSASERSGVLTHPAWLAAHGDNFEDDASLVHRGHWIRENLFCQTVPGLQNVMVQAKLGAQGPSARERVIAATTTGPASPTCLGCHSQMNTLGFPFEMYNHAGFLRTSDHGHAPDGTSTITNAPDPALNTDIMSAVDFAQKLGDSPYAKRCFIRQAFRYFTGRDETLQDACTLAAMETALAGGSFFDMLATLVTSDTFLYRTIDGGAQ